MDQTVLADPGDSRKRGWFRMGMKGLMIMVAACSIIIWAGLSIYDHFADYQPLRVIRSGSVVERRKAAVSLSDLRQTDAETAMAALADALRDEDAEVRAMSAHSLAALVYALNHPAGGTPVASDLLKGRVDVATRQLVPLLSDRDSSVRAAGATSLGLLVWGPRQGPPPFNQLRVPKGQSNVIPRRSAKVINGISDAPFPPELAAALEDESAEVREAAARALARFGPDLDPVIPALIARVEQDERGVRDACAGALWATSPGPAMAPTLIGFLKSRDPYVRGMTAELLGRIGPEARGSVPALIAVLREPFDLEEGNRSDAVPGYPASMAARALARMGPNREAIAALADVISPDNVERARISSAKLHGKAWRPTGDDPLRWAEHLRISAAIGGLGEIGPPAVASVPGLIAAYNKALATRTMAVAGAPAALGQIAPHSAAAPDAVAALIRGLDSEDRSLRLGSVEALGHFGADALTAVPKLRALQSHSDLSTRAAAAKSLEALAR